MSGKRTSELLLIISVHYLKLERPRTSDLITTFSLNIIIILVSVTTIFSAKIKLPSCWQHLRQCT